MYGLTTTNADRAPMVAAKKPTKLMSNGLLILADLCVRHDKSHAHQPLMGGRASKVQVCTYALCRAASLESMRQKQHDKSKHFRSGRLGVRQLKSLISRLGKRDFLEGACKPDNDQSGDTRPHKPRERVIHAPDGRL